jgi:hypothetical protein
MEGMFFHSHIIYKSAKTPIIALCIYCGHLSVLEGRKFFLNYFGGHTHRSTTMDLQTLDIVGSKQKKHLSWLPLSLQSVLSKLLECLH